MCVQYLVVFHQTILQSIRFLPIIFIVTLCCMLAYHYFHFKVEAPRRSPERTHITNFMRANSPEPPRRLSPVARRSPLAAPPPPPVAPRVLMQPPSPTDRPHSEPPKRKTYARDEVSVVAILVQ